MDRHGFVSFVLVLGLCLGGLSVGWAGSEETPLSHHLLVTLRLHGDALSVAEVVTVTAPLPVKGKRMPGFAPYRLVLVGEKGDLRVDDLPDLMLLHVPPAAPGAAADSAPPTVERNEALFSVRLPALQEGQRLELRKRGERAKGDTAEPEYVGTGATFHHQGSAGGVSRSVHNAGGAKPMKNLSGSFWPDAQWLARR